VVDSARDASLDAGTDVAGDATKDLAEATEDVASVIVTVSDAAPDAAADGAADTSAITSPLDATIDSETEAAAPIYDAGSPEPLSCSESYYVSGQPNPNINVVLSACPDLAQALLWADASNQDVPYAAWPSSMRARLATLYSHLLANEALTDLACPDPRGADVDRVVTAAGMPNGTPTELYFAQVQATDMYLASTAQALVLEVRHTLPWSLRDYPSEELEPLLSARSLVVPVTQPPRPFGAPLPEAAYQEPLAHDGLGFVCDPRVGYDFIRGTTSRTGEDLTGATPTETLAKLTFFVTQNSVHGFPLSYQEPFNTYQFSLSERLHRGIDAPAGTPSQTLVERLGCHSTAELVEELARAVNIPVRNVASYVYDWTDGTQYTFRNNSHRGLAYAWSRPAERRILPHADFVNATALWPNYHATFAALDFFNLVWRTPEDYQSMGLLVDMTMPIVPILSTNSDGSFETYFDFGRAFAVLTTSEARYYLRTMGCSWDLARAYCLSPTGDAAAFANNNPYGGYPEFSTPALLQVALNATTACLAALPGGCASVPASFPNLTATNYLP
jgi:hypothetical protein